MQRTKEWVYGYLEAEMTLSITISYLGKDRKKKHVAIYPNISLQSSDEVYLKLLHNFFGFEAKIDKKKNITPKNLVTLYI